MEDPVRTTARMYEPPEIKESSKGAADFTSSRREREFRATLHLDRQMTK